MEQSATFEILIKGLRNGKPLDPGAFDVDEWIATLKNGRNLLYPQSSPKNRPEINFDPQPGSIRILLVTAAAAVIQTNALLAKVGESKELAILP